LLRRTSTVVPPLIRRFALIEYTRHGTSTLAEELRIPPYCASITSIPAGVPVGRSNFTTAATASRFTSGWISPGPGTQARTEGSTTVGVGVGDGVVETEGTGVDGADVAGAEIGGADVAGAGLCWF
jgi:hypothetical protein